MCQALCYILRKKSRKEKKKKEYKTKIHVFQSMESNGKKFKSSFYFIQYILSNINLEMMSFRISVTQIFCHLKADQGNSAY
jgi:hypothetical protein